MTLLHPWALAGLPLVALLWAWARAAALSAAGLPGAWQRLIGPAMARALAGTQHRPAREDTAWLYAAIAVLLLLALSRPVVEAGAPPDPSAFAGRVVVVDLPPGTDAAAVRARAARVLGAMAEVPTALLAAGGEPYRIVPLTTDADHLGRYLAVLDPAVLPVPGHAPHQGLAAAERLLDAAGVAVGQVVLVASDSAPAQARAIGGSGWLRAVDLAPSAEQEGWRRWARAYDAEPAGPDRAAGRLRDAIASYRAAHVPEGQTALAPWLCGLALVLWLGLFRRGEAP